MIFARTVYRVKEDQDGLAGIELLDGEGRPGLASLGPWPLLRHPIQRALRNSPFLPIGSYISTPTPGDYEELFALAAPFPQGRDGPLLVGVPSLGDMVSFVLDDKGIPVIQKSDDQVVDWLRCRESLVDTPRRCSRDHKPDYTEEAPVAPTTPAHRTPAVLWTDPIRSSLADQRSLRS